MLKYTATDTNFFEFDGSKITVRVRGDEELKINRGGAVTTLLKGEVGRTQKVEGIVKAGDVFSLGDKSVSFYDSPESGYQTPEPRVDLPRPSIIPPSFNPLTFVRSLKKYIPERRIVVKNEPGFEVDSKSKKTTFSVGVILLVILAISIGFGVMQKKEKAKQEDAAKIEQEARDREAMGIYQTSPELFLDLTLLSAGFKGDVVSSSGGNLYILDKNSKKIVSIGISSKKSEVVAGQGELDEALDLASYEDRVFISDSEGIKEVDDGATGVIEKDWEGDIFIQAFAGNLYVLDKSAGAIYRFSGSEGGFGSKSNWLASSTKLDFSNAKSWTFDGAIYVLTGSRVLKFSQGSPQNFSLASEILSPSAIYADEENQYLYVLDKEGGKVVVLEKDGKFKAQYSSGEISNAVNLIASETEKKIILLTGEKLLSVEMKHLGN